jgi:uncharacterized protein YbjT (DUF2867 family)
VKILITGGTGYVGSALKRLLVDEGHSVRLLVRKESLGALSSENKYEIAVGDVLDKNSCYKACEGCGAVVHLVGIIREHPALGITFDELHVTATANMAEAAGRQGVKQFIYMSALGARENAPSRYHQTKFAAEAVVRSAPVIWTIFRPSVIFSRDFPGEDEFTKLLVQLARRRVAPLIGGGEALLQPVALEDVCRCIAAALITPETGGAIFELGGSERISFKRMLEQIAAHLGSKPKMVSIPSVFMKPVVRCMERFPQFPLTSDQLTMLLEDNVCDTGPAERIFHFKADAYTRALPGILDSLSKQADRDTLQGPY